MAKLLSPFGEKRDAYFGIKKGLWEAKFKDVKMENGIN
jgi:hypothetical protein